MIIKHQILGEEIFLQADLKKIMSNVYHIDIRLSTRSHIFLYYLQMVTVKIWLFN